MMVMNPERPFLEVERDTDGSTKGLVSDLEVMVRSREFDRRAGVLCRQGRAWLHVSSAGHEGLVGVEAALRKSDLVFPHYRDRPMLLTARMTVLDMARDLLATKESDSGGRNMSAHFSKRASNVFSIASPVASHCLPAAGAAWAIQRRQSDGVVLCSIGDASIRQGEFFEAVMFAVDRSLPLVFLISDNGYGISSATAGLAPLHLPVLSPSYVRAVDGVDPLCVRQAVRTAVDQARDGGGPTILWCKMDRLESHTTSDDQRSYRSSDELAAMRDPITELTSKLFAQGDLDSDRLGEMQRSVQRDVAEAFAIAEADGHAPLASVTKHVFDEACAGERESSPQCRATTMVQAVNDALALGLGVNPDILLFGEDIEDPKGGVFGFTKGLTAVDPHRVVNSPLAEATIVGAAVGLAAQGLRPVVELQFIDFVGPAWNQITSQVSTLRWRTEGRWTCPLVIYAPYGGYLPAGGIWHSQSNESWFTHIPGLRVVIPSTPTDTFEAFLDGFISNDPTLILLPKHLMRIRHDPATSIEQVPAGRARILAAGSDVTVVAWGNGVELAMGARDELESDGVSVEVIDLCWLTPWDRSQVVRSVRKTGRLVVVQEDTKTSSFGATVISEILSDDDSFGSLLGPPRLVARHDVHIPFRPELERATLPSIADTVSAILSLIR